jgi:hypothetical protein
MGTSEEPSVGELLKRIEELDRQMKQIFEQLLVLKEILDSIPMQRVVVPVGGPR